VSSDVDYAAQVSFQTESKNDIASCFAYGRGNTEPSICHVDRLKISLVIAFSDGRGGVYPSSLLHAFLPQAGPMPTPESDDE
jgi:hypothetical protein